MPRPKRIRKMNNPPGFKGFIPIGLQNENIPVVINFEEYEAIRLSDFEYHGQVDAAKIMDVSRPTFTRIYESARRKVAQAFVNGSPIIFEGGKVYFDSEWYACNNCGCWFNHPEKETEVKSCSLCGSTEIEQYSEKSGLETDHDICFCPHCGFEKKHIEGTPCRKNICPKCNHHLIRKGNPLKHSKGNCN